MKKSDMINIISKQLDMLCYRGENINNEAKEFLELIEQAGMLPPRIRTDDIMYFDSERPEGYFPTSNIWDEDLEDLKNA